MLVINIRRVPMSEGNGELSCEEFQSRLPTLLEADPDLDLHPHARSCALCRALVEDLFRIAEEARKFYGGPEAES
jgi:hypothetical protein